MATVDSSFNNQNRRNKSRNASQFRSSMTGRYGKQIDASFLSDMNNSMMEEPGDDDTFNEKIQQDLEMREVSSILAQLRKKHDETKREGAVKETQLKRLNQEIEKLSVEEANAEHEIQRIKDQMDGLEDEITVTRIKTEEEVLSKTSYAHMLERMKKDKIALQIKANGLKTNLRTKRIILDEENSKNRKNKETKVQSQQVLNELMKTIDRDQKKRQERLVSLNKTMRSKQDAFVRREERQQRQLEISELAANEENNSSETQLREGFLVHKLWNSILKKRMEKEMDRAVGLEDSIKKIRAATGLVDINDIMQRFLTREETYSQLLSAVAESEKRINEARMRNKALSEDLRTLNMQSSEENAQGTAITDLDSELMSANKEFQKGQEKFDRGFVVYNRMSIWVRRMWQKVELNVNNSSEGMMDSQPKNTTAMTEEDLLEKFTHIAETITNSLQGLKEGQGGVDNKTFKSSELYQDITTNEFVSRNIRVKAAPIKKVDENSDNKSTFSLPTSDVEGDDEDDNFRVENDAFFSDKRRELKSFKDRKRGY